jgi:DNA-binding transcriptional LysR family regulator
VDIRFLSTFLEVANTRHFGKAADNLYLTQSAVSARIKLLEEYFDTELFIRNRNSIQLTSAGELLIPFAQQLSENLQQAKKALSQSATKTVNCACTPNAYFTAVGNALSTISAGVNDISVRTDLANIELISRQLHDRTIDIGFTTEPLKLDNVQSIKLCELPLALFANQDHQEPLQYIHIEWHQRISDALFKSSEEFKHSSLKTSSASIGLAQLQNLANGCALLPININTSQNLNDTQRLIPIRTAHSVGLNLSVYMSVVQGNILAEIAAVQEYFLRQAKVL